LYAGQEEAAYLKSMQEEDSATEKQANGEELQGELTLQLIRGEEKEHQEGKGGVEAPVEQDHEQDHEGGRK
jgi:hypothetical protein